MCVANTSQDSDTIRYFNLERSGLYHGKSGLLLFTPLTVNDVKLRTLTAGVSLYLVPVSKHLNLLAAPQVDSQVFAWLHFYRAAHDP